MSSFHIKSVAVAHTPYIEKFGIPRQAGLVNVPAVIELLPPFDNADAIAGLEQVSHIWLTFIFNENIESETRLKVRPPRMGGNKKVGVFATRSSFRPNALGQSLVRLDSIEILNNKLFLHVSGIDLLDGTPVVDIKPYLPYADSLPDAVNKLAPEAPERERLQVKWTSSEIDKIVRWQGEKSHKIQQWITELICLDPRPAYKKAGDQREFGMAVFNMNIRWQMLDDNNAEVISVQPLQEKPICL